MTKEKYLTLKEIFADAGKFKGEHATMNCAMCFISANNQENLIRLKLVKNYDESKKTRKQFNSVMRVAKILGKKVETTWQ